MELFSLLMGSFTLSLLATLVIDTAAFSVYWALIRAALRLRKEEV